jgi:hypothetical protein
MYKLQNWHIVTQRNQLFVWIDAIRAKYFRHNNKERQLMDTNRMLFAKNMPNVEK